MILVDTGPLVAIIHEDDDLHEHGKKEFLSFREPLGTVWPVVTEALYLLNFAWQAQTALLEILELGAVELLPLRKNDVSRIKELMWKYRTCLWTSPTLLWCAWRSARSYAVCSPSTGAILKSTVPRVLAVFQFFQLDNNAASRARCRPRRSVR